MKRSDATLSCNDCKKYTPEMFMVEDDEWDSVVGKKNHNWYLCEKCYDIRRINKNVSYGPRRQINFGNLKSEVLKLHI